MPLFEILSLRWAAIPISRDTAERSYEIDLRTQIYFI